MQFSVIIITVRNFIFHVALIVSHESARNKREERQQEFAYAMYARRKQIRDTLLFNIM